VPSRPPAYVTHNEGVPEDFGSANGETSLVILEDLLNDVYSMQVCELFTRGSHHRNISVVLIAQNLCHQGRFCTDISLNAHYIVSLKNVRVKKQYMYLDGQVYPEDSLVIYNAYLDASKEAHGYLLLDLTQNKIAGLRFRSYIFPDEIHLITVYSYVGDEASEVELSNSAGSEDGRPEIV